MKTNKCYFSFILILLFSFQALAQNSNADDKKIKLKKIKNGKTVNLKRIYLNKNLMVYFLEDGKEFKLKGRLIDADSINLVFNNYKVFDQKGSVSDFPKDTIIIQSKNVTAFSVKFSEGWFPFVGGLGLNIGGFFVASLSLQTGDLATGLLGLLVGSGIILTGTYFVVVGTILISIKAKYQKDRGWVLVVE